MIKKTLFLCILPAIFLLLENFRFPDTPSLDVAMKAEKWIASCSRKTVKGKAWAPDPQDTIYSGTRRLPTNIYHGVSGVVLFYLELYHSTNDERYLTEAMLGADYLINSLPDAFADLEDIGLYTGIAGIGYTLDQVYLASEKKEFRKHAKRCVELIEKFAIEKEGGIEWIGGINDIMSGSAGIGLFLLYAAETMDHSSAGELAEKIGGRLLKNYVRDSTGGMKWMMMPFHEKYYPNFSHGTAGVSYFLASLYEKTNRKEFLDAALSGASHLASIASGDGLLCHNQPEGKDLYYLGWCHGPVGTGKLYYKLLKITKEQKWLDKINQSAKAILSSGIPEKQTPGFWNNEGMCCGSAGIADYFIDIHHITGKPEYLEFAKKIASAIESHATPTENGGLKWTHAENRTKPEQKAAQTGYMQGAAGIGKFFLHLNAFEQGKVNQVHLPDDPF